MMHVCRVMTRNSTQAALCGNGRARLKLASRIQSEVNAKAVLQDRPRKKILGETLRQPDELLIRSTPRVPTRTPIQPTTDNTVPKNQNPEHC